MKRLCLILALLLLLCGCSPGEEDRVLIPKDSLPGESYYSGESFSPESSYAPNYDENTLLYTVNLLRMGTVEGNAPFAFREEDGYLDGVDLAVGKQIAIDLGKEIKITPMERDELIPALLSGDIHIALAALTAEQVDGITYSTPYLEKDGKAYCAAFKSGDDAFVKAVNDIIISLIEYDDMQHIWTNYTGEAYEGGDQ